MDPHSNPDPYSHTMTNLSKAPHNITADLFGTEASNLPQLFSALVNMALILLSRYGRGRSAKTRTALKITLTLLYILHGGSAEERRDFVERLLASQTKRLDQLYAKYLLWRQRQCWNWGGGFRAARLGFVTDVPGSPQAIPSFDALIPD